MAVNEHDPDRDGAEDARIAALYRTAAAEVPPERLDRAIRDAARRPFEAAVPKPRTPWWHAWRMPVAFAGVAVLGVSVVIVAQREGGEPLKIEASSPATTEAVAPPTSPGAPAATEAPPSQSYEAARSPAPPAPPEARKRAAESDLARQTQQQALETAPVERERRSREPDAARPRAFPGADSSAAGDRRDKPAEPQSDRTEPERTPALNERAPVSRPAERLAAPPEAPAAIAPAPARPESAPSVLQKAPPPPPPPPQKSEAAPPPKPAPAAKPAMRAPSEFGAGSAAPSMGIRGFAREALPLPELIAELDGRPPQQWIDRITLLRSQGRREEADALLGEFRRRYPDEPLPPSLR